MAGLRQPLILPRGKDVVSFYECTRRPFPLVTVQSPKDAKGNTDTTRKVMVFVKCDVLSVK